MNKEIAQKLLNDPTASQVYLWLIINADRNKVTLNGNKAAKDIGLKRSTFQSALKRLCNHRNIIAITSQEGNNIVELLGQEKQEVQKESVASPSQVRRNTQEEKERSKEREEYYISSLRSETQGQLPGLKFPKKIPNSQPSKHPYSAIIAYCREKQGIEQQFAFYGKQTKASKEIFDCGYTEEDAKFVIDQMVKEDFWKAHPFDMMNVAKNMHTYMNRTIMFKPKQKGKYAYN